MVSRHPQPISRQPDPNRLEWVLHKYVKQLELGHGYSTHSMRATLVTTALKNGAKLEDLQRTTV
jgi:integrase/recombinase XerD